MVRIPKAYVNEILEANTFYNASMLDCDEGSESPGIDKKGKP